ncbi:hypothetical protein GGF32_004021 [Allomyces javanicus]|nr:hypothetical protein GGF32_004021 [Allomyces javanicus]
MNLDMGVKPSWTDAMAAADLYGGKAIHISGTMRFEYQPSGVSNRKSAFYAYSLDLGVPKGRLNDIAGAFTIPNVTSGTDLQAWNLELTLTFHGAHPTSDPMPGRHLAKFLHRRAYCDCSLLAMNAPGPLYASRTVLSSVSPFFRAMFKGEWAELRQGTDTPIQFMTWRAPVVVLAIIYICSGWLPGMVLPKESKRLVREFVCDPATFDFLIWRELFERAQMLELKPLMLAVNRQLADMLEAQFRDLVTAEAVPVHQFSESDDDEAEPSGGAEGAAKSPDQVEQAASVAAE